ncbi:MAG: hypothetical protein ACO3JL_10940 [Myxococcota bacterium]
MSETFSGAGSLDGQTAEALLARLVADRFVGRCRFIGELEGELSLHDGVVTTALVRDESGMPAVMRLLGLARGDYQLVSLRADEVSLPPSPVGNWPEVADHFRWRCVQLDRLARPLGGSHQLWALRPERCGIIPPHLAPIAALLEGARSVHDVVTLAPLALEECVAGLQVLFSLGALRVPFEQTQGAVNHVVETSPAPSVSRVLSPALEDHRATGTPEGQLPEQQAQDSPPTRPLPTEAAEASSAAVDVEDGGAPAEASSAAVVVEEGAETLPSIRTVGRPLPPPGGEGLPSSGMDSGDAQDAGCQRWSSQGAPPPAVLDDFEEPGEERAEGPYRAATRMNLNLTRSLHRGTKLPHGTPPDGPLDDEDLRALAVVQPGVKRMIAAAGVIAVGVVVGYVLGQL